MPSSKHRRERIAIDGVRGQPKWDTRLSAMGYFNPDLTNVRRDAPTLSAVAEHLQL